MGLSDSKWNCAFVIGNLCMMEKIHILVYCNLHCKMKCQDKTCSVFYYMEQVNCLPFNARVFAPRTDLLPVYDVNEYSLSPVLVPCLLPFVQGFRMLGQWQ